MHAALVALGPPTKNTLMYISAETVHQSPSVNKLYGVWEVNPMDPHVTNGFEAPAPTTAVSTHAYSTPGVHPSASDQGDSVCNIVEHHELNP